MRLEDKIEKYFWTELKSYKSYKTEGDLMNLLESIYEKAYAEGHSDALSDPTPRDY